MVNTKDQSQLTINLPEKVQVKSVFFLNVKRDVCLIKPEGCHCLGQNIIIRKIKGKGERRDQIPAGKTDGKDPLGNAPPSTKYDKSSTIRDESSTNGSSDESTWECTALP